MFALYLAILAILLVIGLVGALIETVFQMHPPERGSLAAYVVACVLWPLAIPLGIVGIIIDRRRS